MPASVQKVSGLVGAVIDDVLVDDLLIGRRCENKQPDHVKHTANNSGSFGRFDCPDGHARMTDAQVALEGQSDDAQSACRDQRVHQRQFQMRVVPHRFVTGWPVTFCHSAKFLRIYVFIKKKVNLDLCTMTVCVLSYGRLGSISNCSICHGFKQGLHWITVFELPTHSRLKISRVTKICKTVFFKKWFVKNCNTDGTWRRKGPMQQWRGCQPWRRLWDRWSWLHWGICDEGWTSWDTGPPGRSATTSASHTRGRSRSSSPSSAPSVFSSCSSLQLSQAFLYYRIICNLGFLKIATVTGGLCDFFCDITAENAVK